MAFFNGWYIMLDGESGNGQYLPSWGIKTHVDADIAAPKTNYRDIHGLNGSIDYSEFFTGVKYQNRQVRMYLVIRDEDIPSTSGFQSAQEVCAEFARKYHGQRVEILRSTDGIGGEWQSYKGRLQITADSKTNGIRLVVCAIDADPFVYLGSRMLEIQPMEKEEYTLVLDPGMIVEDGGLDVSSVGVDRTYFSSGAIGRYAVWNLYVYANTVIFPKISGSASPFNVDFLTSDGEAITLDGGGYYSTSNGTIKVKITARTTNAFNVGITYLSFDYVPHSTNEMRNVNDLKMPSDLFYTNQNEGASLFVNGKTYPLDVTGAEESKLLIDLQLIEKKSNWIAVLVEDEQGVEDVVIGYENKDLVGVPDV